MARSLGFYGDGISFWVVFSQSFWLRVLPGGTCFIQPRWMPEKRILGGGWTCGVSFWPFLNSSHWWWLISSEFLTRPPVLKQLMQMVTMVTGQGRGVSVSVLPLAFWYAPKLSRASILFSSQPWIPSACMVRGRLLTRWPQHPLVTDVAGDILCPHRCDLVKDLEMSSSWVSHKPKEKPL